MRAGASAWVAAGLAGCVALALALGPARVTRPATIFPKYLAAAAAPAGEQAERLLDYSPLYLGMVRAVVRTAGPGLDGALGVLVLQALLHVLTAVAVALAVARLAGPAWAAVAGLGVASYRPFLVYAGVHEPETLIVACLALAVLAGVAAQGGAVWSSRMGGSAVGRVGAPAGGRSESMDAAARSGGGASSFAPPAGAPTLPGDALHPSGVWRWRVWPLVAFAALAAAGLGRPHHLVLLPVWAFWLGFGRSTRERLWLWVAAFGVGLLLVGPVVASRWRSAGAPVVMNPGPVFYEGNAPGATGLLRSAPAAVIALERAHGEAFDYGHVAYRRIAGAVTNATGAPAGPRAATRYWTGLALEGLRADPVRWLRRLVKKAGLALMPYEAHDLTNAEQADRRLRRLLPWGFALLLVAVPWIPLARRARWQELAGPLALAALAVLLQTAAYASARQRLPLALALWVVGPVLAADLARGRLNARVRPALALVLGVAGSALLAGLTGPTALRDQLGWDRLLGPQPPGFGERLVAWQDGRTLRPRLRTEAEHLSRAVAALKARRPAAALVELSSLEPGRDLTIDDRVVGVPAYQAALALLALGSRDAAAAAAVEARRVRPFDPRVAALALRLADPPGFQAAAAGDWRSWRPAGADPVSARLALSAAAAADRDPAAVRTLLAPLAAAFPELATSPR